MEPQSSTKITQLAAIIATGTIKVDEWLTSHGLPSPSFEIETPPKLELPGHILQARQAVIEATTELQALMLGPVGYLQNETREHNNLIAIQAIYRFDIAHSFPVDEEASYEQISQVCGLPEQTLRRILRFAMTRHFFKEPRKGIVAHTATSKAFVQIPMLREYVGMVCEEMWPAAARTVEAMIKWPGSQEPNHTGFTFVNNTEDPIFTELGKFPARSKRFANTMEQMSTNEGFEPEHLIEAFSWDAIRARLFVDVGGSLGRFSVVLADKVKDIHCIVQDLPEVVVEGSAKLPARLTDRVTFMAHDFFTEQPVTGADVYFFRWIFHDWSDKYCIQILRCLIPALKHGARVIISDMTLPPTGEVSPYQEWLMRTFDLAMLELLNASEREPDDWVSLFERADVRFKFVDIKCPPGSALSFIEAKWEIDSSS